MHSMKNNKKIRSHDPQLARESELYENPIPSRELILQIMEEHGVPIKKSDLIKMLDIEENEINFLKKELGNGATRTNSHKSKRCPVHLKKINLSSGRVMGHPDGYGFLIPDDETMDDVFLSPKEMSQVFNKDRVMVQVTGQDRRGRLEGKIVEVFGEGK